MRSPPFDGCADWTIRWLDGTSRRVTLDRRGRFEVFGVSYTLLPTSPVTFAWADGTVQTVQSVEGTMITWTTNNAACNRRGARTIDSRNA